MKKRGKVKDKDKKIILVISLLLVIFLLAIALNNYLTGRAIQGINLSPPLNYVAYYSFDGGLVNEKVVDATGNFNGDIIGTLTQVPGYIGNAYQFSGTNRVNLATSPLSQALPNGYAISAWVNRD